MHTVDRMHEYRRAGDIVYCIKCGAGAHDDPTMCPPRPIPCPQCKKYLTQVWIDTADTRGGSGVVYACDHCEGSWEYDEL